MLRKVLVDELGYSLVEVMASIIILSIAIIPMVAMFDSGLKAASTSGNYDIARAFANKKLEQAKSLPYAQVRDNFPRSGDGTPGTASSITNATEVGVPNNYSYTIRKRHLSMTPTAFPDQTNLIPADPALGDTGLIQVTATVNWSGKSYSSTSVVAKDVP